MIKRLFKVFSFFTLMLFFVMLIGCESTEETITFNETQINMFCGDSKKIEIFDDVLFVYDENDGFTFDETTKTIKALKKGNYKIIIKLTKNPNVTKEIMIVIDEKQLATYTISYDLDEGECDNLIESFTENSNISLPTPTKEGYDFLGWYEGDTLINVIENRNYTLKAKWEQIVLNPKEIEITIQCDDEEIYLDSVVRLTYKVLPDGCNQEVEFKTMLRRSGSIDEDGYVTFINGEECEFKVSSKENSEISAKIKITPKKYNNPQKLLDLIKVDEVVAKKVYAYMAFDNKTYLLGGLVNFLFEDVKVIEKFVSPTSSNRPGKSSNGNAFKVRYVTVHDVGWTGSAATTANNNGSSASWHFSIGNDGIYQGIPTDEVAYHAGDGTSIPLTFSDSLIKAEKNDPNPAVITINQVSGCFEVNGKQTTIVAPLSEYNRIVKNTELPYTGINYYIDSETNNYMIGATYWNSTYNTLSNRGGNLNSIGIETSILEGSNIYYTWEITAKFIATQLLNQNGIKPKDVKQHNTFSGKDCPMTMRHANMWENFMRLVEAEYMKYTYFKNWDLEFICDSSYINPNGMIKELPNEATKVDFKIRLSNGTDYDKTIDYSLTLPAKDVLIWK